MKNPRPLALHGELLAQRWRIASDPAEGRAAKVLAGETVGADPYLDRAAEVRNQLALTSLNLGEDKEARVDCRYLQHRWVGYWGSGCEVEVLPWGDHLRFRSSAGIVGAHRPAVHAFTARAGASAAA